MDLEYKMKGALASSRPQVVRVEFDPPLLGYDEVKPRLLGMKVDADEALGTVRESIRFVFPNSSSAFSLDDLQCYRSRLRRSRISSCRSRSGSPRPSYSSRSMSRACRTIPVPTPSSGGWHARCVPGSFRIGFSPLSGRSLSSYTRQRVPM
jgi:hypothetical protein